MPPYRNPNSGPALWLPGVIWFEFRNPRNASPASSLAVVRTGAQVGFTYRALDDFKSTTTEVHFVEKAALTEDIRDRLSLALPEHEIDPTRFPLVHRAALAASLVCVRHAACRPLRARGVRVYSLAPRLDGLGLGSMTAADANDRATSFDFDNMSFTQDPDHWKDHDIDDRLLCHASHGRLDAASVGLAFGLALARGFRDEFYGGRARSSSRSSEAGPLVEASLTEWEAWLAEIFDHARTTEAQARAVAAATLQSSADAAATINLPGYLDVRRVTLPAFDVMGLGLAESDIVLPAATQLVVSGVEPWHPTRPSWPRLPTVRQRETRLRAGAGSLGFLTLLVFFSFVLAWLITR